MSTNKKVPTYTVSGNATALNISAATAIKAIPGRVIRAMVITAGTTVGTVNDSATTGGAAAANQIASIPNTVGPIHLDFPCANGITIVPGTGQVVSVSYM